MTEQTDDKTAARAARAEYTADTIRKMTGLPVQHAPNNPGWLVLSMAQAKAWLRERGMDG